MTLTVPTLVMLSLPLPLLVARDAVGAAAAVSSVKVNALEAALVLPATSVCRSVTDLAPSADSVTLLLLPAVQLVPALRLYSQVAPVSNPVTLTVPMFVMLSLPLPLLVAREAAGAEGAVPSRVKVSALEAVLVLPAASVCRTVTDLEPSTDRVTLLLLPGVQFVPESVLYCQVAPSSSPETLTVPTLVRLSAPLPLLAASVGLGAATTVST